MTAIHGSRAAVSRRHSATVARCRQMAVDRLVLHIYIVTFVALDPRFVQMSDVTCAMWADRAAILRALYSRCWERKERRERDKERDRAERMIVKRLKRAVPQLIAGHGGA